MKRRHQFASALLIATLLAPAAFAAPVFLKGIIEKEGSTFFVKTPSERFELKGEKKIMDSIPSLQAPSFVTQSNKKPYNFEFKGRRDGKQFFLSQVPTNIPGATAITGLMTYNAEEDLYYVDGRPAIYGYTKVLNGYEFDDISKKSFVGSRVLAEGDLNEDGILVMQAVTPVNLFEAGAPDKMDKNLSNKLDEKGPKDFILKDMPLNEISQHEGSFRSVIYENQSRPVVPGDKALIITLSGRQGDSFGSVNGHFVAGLADVRDDMTLRGEVSNAYVTNGKDILSGNTSLTNYFSHTVQGQNQYRPTYTLIAYGIDAKKLQQFRDSLEASHIEFRTKKLDITAQFNCTTETVKALKAAGIEGKYTQADNWVKAPFGWLSRLVLWGETGATLSYAASNDASRYHPRRAFNSFLNRFMNKKSRKKLGIKRVDYVFYQQIPSHRPIGGMALGKPMKAPKWKKLYDKYEVEAATKLSPEDLRPLLEERLQEIPY